MCYSSRSFIFTKIADAIELLIYGNIDSKKMIDEGTRAVKETFNWKVEEKNFMMFIIVYNIKLELC